MIKAPHLTTFSLSSSMLYWFFIVLLCCSYVTVYPSPCTSLKIPFTTLEIPSRAVDVFFAPIRSLVNLTGYRPSVRMMAGTISAIHAVESLYTWSLCKRYVRGWNVKAAYVVSTLIFGMPAWMDIQVSYSNWHTTRFLGLRCANHFSSIQLAGCVVFGIADRLRSLPSTGPTNLRVGHFANEQCR